MAKRKIALFGGTFDPIHRGHTTVALAAAEVIDAEKIIFIPARRSPLKNNLPVAGDRDRLRMIASAIADDNKCEVSDCELKRPEPSYTLQTVKQFQIEYGCDTVICWLAGADSIDALQYWYKIEELIDECDLCLMYRAGFEPPDFSKFKELWGADRVEKLQRNVVPTPLIDVSSTEIRNRLAAGDDAADMLHPAVADYIRKHNLYRGKSTLP